MSEHQLRGPCWAGDMPRMQPAFGSPDRMTPFRSTELRHIRSQASAISCAHMIDCFSRLPILARQEDNGGRLQPAEPAPAALLSLHLGMWLRQHGIVARWRVVPATRGHALVLSAPTLAVGLAVTLARAGIPPTALGDQHAPLAITLRLRDTAQVPDDVLTRASDEVTRIYRQAGVETLWPRAASLSAESSAVRKGALTIGILSDEQAERLLPVIIRHSVGVAMRGVMGDGRIAYVFYGRVLMLSGANGVGRAQVLAAAIAHEIGHLLLPDHGHSKTGLMRADWTKADLHLAQHGRLLFTAEEGELLRSRLRLRWSHPLTTLVPKTRSP